MAVDWKQWLKNYKDKDMESDIAQDQEQVDVENSQSDSTGDNEELVDEWDNPVPKGKPKPVPKDSEWGDWDDDEDLDYDKPDAQELPEELQEDIDRYPNLFDGDGDYLFTEEPISSKIVQRLIMSLYQEGATVKRDYLRDHCLDFHIKHGGGEPDSHLESWLGTALKTLSRLAFLESVGYGVYVLRDTDDFVELDSETDPRRRRSIRKERLKIAGEKNSENDAHASSIDKDAIDISMEDSLKNGAGEYVYSGQDLSSGIMSHLITSVLPRGEWLHRKSMLDTAMSIHLDNGGLRGSRGKTGLANSAVLRLQEKGFILKGTVDDGAPGNRGFYKILDQSVYGKTSLDEFGPDKHKKSSRTTETKAAVPPVGEHEPKAPNIKKSISPKPASLSNRTEFKMSGMELVVGKDGSDSVAISLSPVNANDGTLTLNLVGSDAKLVVTVSDMKNFRINGERPYLGQVVELSLLGVEE